MFFQLKILSLTMLILTIDFSLFKIVLKLLPYLKFNCFLRRFNGNCLFKSYAFVSSHLLTVLVFGETNCK